MRPPPSSDYGRIDGVIMDGCPSASCNVEDPSWTGSQSQIKFAKPGERVMMRCLFDSLSLSRYGESSGELSSVMILIPSTGNSLEKAVGQDRHIT
jgi:hypothetical protein